MSPEEQLVALERLRLEATAPATTSAGIPPPPRQAGVQRPLMTVSEVGAFFQKTQQAIYKMIERDQLAGVTRVGRRLYIRRADLLRSLAEGRVPSPGRSR